MNGKLYLCPTPIGNLNDITYRTLETLKSVDLIAAEDTRVSAKLLNHFDIKVPTTSYYEHNKREKGNYLIEKLLSGTNIAVITDAGMPGISDPGFLLARACADAGIEVQTLPGPTACIPAIVSSGLPCDRFAFEGFLPQKKGRQTHLQALSTETRTMIFYESPYRLVKTLEQFAEYFGAERQCSVAREISKMFEEHRRGTLQEVAAWYREHEPKGEIVIVVAGAVPEKLSKKKRYGRGEDETETA